MPVACFTVVSKTRMGQRVDALRLLLFVGLPLQGPGLGSGRGVELGGWVTSSVVCGAWAQRRRAEAARAFAQRSFVRVMDFLSTQSVASMSGHFVAPFVAARCGLGVVRRRCRGRGV